MVRYNFSAPKQVLDIFRALCQGQTAPYADLCKLFDTETRHGQDNADPAPDAEPSGQAAGGAGQ